MLTSGLLQPKGPTAARSEPSDGDWRGRLYNAQLPWLRSLGYDVVPGTLDAEGCGLVDPDGRRKRLVLLSPGVSEIRDDDRDPCPSDNYPDIPARYALVFGRPPRPSASYRGVAIHPEH